MTDAQVENVLHKPNPWLTLIPFWIVSGAVSLVVGILTILVMLGAAPKYHMNIMGHSDATMSAAPVQTGHAGASTRNQQSLHSVHDGDAARPAS